MFIIDSITKLHELMGCAKPRHPLITLMDLNSLNPQKEIFNTKYSHNFYQISLKNNPECELRYGRRNYDFHEGSLIFIAPGQVLYSGDDHTDLELDGWILCIHPDLIRCTVLGRKIRQYTFFEYEANEALHLSDEERKTIETITSNIQSEYSGNLDSHSNDLIISNLELLLQYSERFYNRQFMTRKAVYRDVIIEFEKIMNMLIDVEKIEQSGIPTVKQIAADMGYSPNYLSDMLKKETGKTAQEQIKLRIYELAENMLLATDEPINRIADKLGFEQPSIFTKFLKAQSGLTPLEFRKKYAQ